MRDVKHIFFDLDHTLWDFDANSKETLGELYLDFNLEALGNNASAEFFIRNYLEHNERVWKMYREQRISKGRLRKVRFELALKDIGINDKSLAKRIGNAYMEICPRKSTLNEGARELLTALKSEYNLHILSNGFHETQLIKLSSAGIDSFFTEVITSEKANSRKPKPPMYSFALRQTGASSSECLMIGDSFEIDVAGALAANWKAIHFDPSGKSKYTLAVQKLGEISALLL